VKAAIAAGKASQRCARFAGFNEDNLPELIDDDPVSDPRGIARPQLRAARLYLAKTPTFSQQDCNKALADAKSPPYQPRNSKFVPHRTDEEGLVTFDDQDTIEQHEEWNRRKALKLRKELFPNTDDDSFFVKGSEIRKVYSMKPDSSFETVMCKAQKRKKRQQ